jgi:hypothetical protein
MAFAATIETFLSLCGAAIASMHSLPSAWHPAPYALFYHLETQIPVRPCGFSRLSTYPSEMTCHPTVVAISVLGGASILAMLLVITDTTIRAFLQCPLIQLVHGRLPVHPIGLRDRCHLVWCQIREKFPKESWGIDHPFIVFDRMLLWHQPLALQAIVVLLAPVLWRQNSTRILRISPTLARVTVSLWPPEFWCQVRVGLRTSVR